MHKIISSTIAALAIFTGPALSADLRPMPVKAVPVAPASQWDWAFGAWAMSDYNFRGISQSNRGPSATVYSETRFNVTPSFQIYGGSQTWAVTLPTDPTAEVDFYGGIRPTIGPFAFDFGAMYYWYPRERQHATGAIGAPFPSFPNGNLTLKNTDFWEGYGKVAWDVIKDRFAIGAAVYYAPSWLNTGANGTFAAANAKVTLPSFALNFGMIDQIGWYISGEVGHYWLGTTDVVPVVFPVAINLPDYTTWNAGVAFTWKVATLDLRYYDTDLSRVNCNLLTGDPGAAVTAAGVASKWCDATFIATLKFDLTLANLK
ncbi:MAG: TorF family putative porin [Xanthobacteraceae bacterium]